MSAPSLPDLRSAVTRAGGTLEEDTGYREMRQFQLVAPRGHLWAGADVQCYPVAWGTGRAAVDFNKTAMADALDTISHGLRAMTAEELDLYDEGDTP